MEVTRICVPAQPPVSPPSHHLPVASSEPCCEGIATSILNGPSKQSVLQKPWNGAGIQISVCLAQKPRACLVIHPSCLDPKYFPQTTCVSHRAHSCLQQTPVFWGGRWVVITLRGSAHLSSGLENDGPLEGILCPHQSCMSSPTHSARRQRSPSPQSFPETHLARTSSPFVDPHHLT